MSLNGRVEYRGALGRASPAGAQIHPACETLRPLGDSDAPGEGHTTTKAAAQSDQRAQIEQVLDSVRPAMEADGGGVEFVSYGDGVLTVRLIGMCLACPSASLTMKLAIERTVVDHLPWVRAVVGAG